MRALSDDVRFALRRVFRTPREITPVVLTVMLGTALICAGWALLEAVLLRPLPYAHPDRLVKVWDAAEALGYRHIRQREFQLLRESVAEGESLAAYAPMKTAISTAPDEEGPQVRALLVTSEFFDVLGVRPTVGRVFTPADERISPVLPAIVSERLKRWDMDLDVGRTIYLDRLPYVVVGVMPERFWFPDPETLVWLPTVFVEGPGVATWLRPVVARLPVGMEAPAFAARATSTLRRAGRSTVIRAQSYEDLLFESVRTPVIVLEVGTGLLLLLVCVNASWLFGWRIRRQVPSFALMASFGASRWRLWRVSAIETLLAGGLSMPGGVLLGFLVLGTIKRLGTVPGFAEAGLTGTVLMLTAATTSLAVIAAWVPAVRRLNGTTAGCQAVNQLQPGQARTRAHVLVMIVQVAVVFAISVLATTLSLSFKSLVEANVGLRRTDFVVGRISMRTAGRDPAVQAARLVVVLERLGEGAQEAAVTNALPLTGVDYFRNAYQAGQSAATSRMVAVRLVSPSFFTVAGVELIEGRAFTPVDDPQAAVVDADLAQLLFDGQGAVGQRLRLGVSEWHVIGVARPVGHGALLEDAPPALYVPFESAAMDAGLHDVFLLVTGAGPNEEAAARIADAVKTELPEAHVEGVWAFRDLVRQASGVRPLLVSGASLFACAALALMAAGFHGLVAQRFLARRKETGIRIALGATPARILSETATEFALVCLGGLGVGVCLAGVLTWAVGKSVFVPDGVMAPHAGTVAGVSAAILLGVVALACFRPIIRALRTDPAVVLRVD